MPTPREEDRSRAVTLEIGVDSADDAAAAVAAGADRIELCSALTLHGLTPSTGSMHAARARAGVPIIALVRPSARGFVVDPGAWSVARAQAAALLDAGAAGIAFGCLAPDGGVDAARAGEMARLCGPRAAVFHRAFDLAPDPGDALERLIDAGVGRVLTAGMEAAETARVLGLSPGAPPAAVADPLGARLSRLRALAERARGRIEIVACGGVRPDNAARFVREGGCTRLHSACRAPGATRVDAAMVTAVRRAIGGGPPA